MDHTCRGHGQTAPRQLHKDSSTHRAPQSAPVSSGLAEGMVLRARGPATAKCRLSSLSLWLHSGPGWGAVPFRDTSCAENVLRTTRSERTVFKGTGFLRRLSAAALTRLFLYLGFLRQGKPMSTSPAMGGRAGGQGFWRESHLPHGPGLSVVSREKGGDRSQRDAQAVFPRCPATFLISWVPATCQAGPRCPPLTPAPMSCCRRGSPRAQPVILCPQLSSGARLCSHKGVQLDSSPY